MPAVQRRRWFDGSSDALDNTTDVGPGNGAEPDQKPDPTEPLRKVMAQHSEFACMNPEAVMIECQEQDEMLGLSKGTTYQLFIDSLK